MSIIATPILTEAELDAIARIEALHQRVRFSVADTHRWTAPLRRIQVARATRASSAIEGFGVSEDDALAAVEGRKSDNDSQAQKAVESHARAMTYILRRARAELTTHSPDLLLSLHFMMAEYDLRAGPGQWRTSTVVVRNEATGTPVYEGPDYREVPALIDELIEAVDADDDHHALVRAAMAHLNLVMIHPWMDGNGRMSRALQTSVLAARYADRLAPEFVSIDEWLGTEAHTAAYYQILNDVGGSTYAPDEVDAIPWIRFCLQAHYEQALAVEHRVAEATDRDLKVEALVASTGAPTRSVVALAAAGQGRELTNGAYRDWVDLDISVASASKDLRRLVDLGLLVKQGDKRGANYVAGPPLAAIEAELAAARQPAANDDLFA